MVFQAVAEYYKQVRDRRNMELDVEVSVSGRGNNIRWKFSEDNLHLTRSDKVIIFGGGGFLFFSFWLSVFIEQIY